MSYEDVVGGAVGGLAAALLTHPLDVARIRRQLPHDAAVPARALRGLYRGVVAGCAREVVYCGVKLGLYVSVRDSVDPLVPFGSKIITASLCGVVATAFSHPLDLLKVVRVANSDPQSSYDVISRNLWRQRQLWRGVSVSMQRAALFSGTQLAAYDSAKQWLLAEVDAIDESVAITLSAWLAGICSTLASNPVEVVKLRIQAARFTSTVDCIKSLAKHEGLRSFWRGAGWTWLRMGPYTFVQLVVWESVRSAMAPPTVEPSPSTER